MLPYKFTKIVIVVAAGGRGTRLRGILPGSCKSLVNIAGRPLLYWALKRVASDQISAAAIISNNDSISNCIESATYVMPTVPILSITQPGPVGTMDALQRGLHRLKSYSSKFENLPVAFLLGDNIPSQDCINQGMPLLYENGAVFYTRYTHHPGSSTRVFRDSFKNRIVLYKQPEETTDSPTEVCAGLYLYGPWIWGELKDAKRPRDLQSREWNIDLLNHKLPMKRPVSFLKTFGDWFHINTPLDLRQTEFYLRNRLYGGREPMLHPKGDSRYGNFLDSSTFPYPDNILRNTV